MTEMYFFIALLNLISPIIFPKFLFPDFFSSDSSGIVKYLQIKK